MQKSINNYRCEESMKTTIGLIEKVKVIGKKPMDVLAKFDTGAKGNSIDKKLADEIGLEPIKSIRVGNVFGKHKRYVANVVFEIQGRRFETKTNISDRGNLAYPVLIGRNLIHGNFVIDVEKSNKSPKERDLR